MVKKVKTVKEELVALGYTAEVSDELITKRQRYNMEKRARKILKRVKDR